MRIFIISLLLLTALSLHNPIKLNFGDFLTSINPSLSQLRSDDCFSLLKNLSNPNTTEEFILREMIYIYSSHNYQDLGDYQACGNNSNLTYISGNATINDTISVYFGICGPSACDASDYAFLVDLENSDLPSEFQDAVFAFSDPTTYVPDSKTGLIVASTIIGFVIFLSVIGTLMTEFYKSQDKKREEKKFEREAPVAINDSLVNSLIDNQQRPSETRPSSKVSSNFRKLWECFDLFTNFEDLMNDDRNPQHDDNLRVFNGIRVLSFCWVVFGHTTQFTAGYAKNIIEVELFFNSVWFLTVYAALFAVDLFYMMSGFFAGYILIQKAKYMRPGVINYFKIFLHRFLRIWPSYVLCILFFWKILPWLGSGPLWYTQLEFSSLCDNTWWRNFLFIDNLDGKNSDVCYGWGWYLSTDFQIFLVVPIIAWIYHRDKGYGRGVLWLLIIFSICSGYFEAIKTETYYSIPIAAGSKFWQDYYANSFVRASPYLIGTFFGIMYKKFKTGEERNFFNNLQESGLLCLFSSLVGLFAILFISYYPRVLQNGGSPWPLGLAYTWEALNRPLYVTGMFIFIAPVLSGNFNWIKEVLGIGIFNLLSKLTFTMYLVHYIILEFTFWTDSQMVDLTGMSIYMRALGVVCLTAVAAGSVHLFIEKPFGNLEVKLLNPKKTQKSDSSIVEEKRMVKQEFQDSK